MRRWLAVAIFCALGCSRAVTPPLEIAQKSELPKIRTLAVVPVAASPKTAGDAAARAPQAVTAMLADAAARQPGWALAETARVRDALAGVPAADAESRAGAVAAKMGVDAALTATVALYAERKGSDYGATDGAAVSVKILLVTPGAKQAAWQADYTIHQVPLTYNLWNLWGVTRGGLRWLTVDDLARIGIDEAVDRLAKATGSR